MSNKNSAGIAREAGAVEQDRREFEAWAAHGTNPYDLTLSADGINYNNGQTTAAAIVWINARKSLRAQLEAAERVIAQMIDSVGNEQLARFIEKHGEPVPLVAERDAAIARAEAAEADAARMDWLVGHNVEVRYPLRHGSRHLFHAQQLNDECDEHQTDLRAQIDAARTKEAAP